MNMNIKSYLLLSIVFLVSCINEKTAGRLGTSESKEASLKNGLYNSSYAPNKLTIELLDGSTVTIDTAWAESSWAFDGDAKPVIADSYGYNFVIPIKKKEEKGFTFNLRLLNKDNEAFTNGIEASRCILNPSKITDKVDVIVVEKNPDKEIGWQQPLVTDTLRFLKIKKSDS